MKVIVYLDVFFLLNLGMNWLVLAIHGKILRRKAGWVRMTLGSVLGALGACALLVIPIHNDVAAFLVQYAVIGYAMVRVTYRNLPIRSISRYILALYVVTVFTGGAVQFIGEALGVQRSGVLLVVACGFFLYVAVRVAMWGWGGAVKKEAAIYEVNIQFHDRTVTGYGYYDTGNLLKEPISGSPVIIAEYESVKELFSEDARKEIAVFPEYGEDGAYALPLRFIPYHSLGVSEGVLPGIEVDGVGVGEGKGRRWYEGVYLAVYKGSLSVDKSYQFILHQECSA